MGVAVAAVTAALALGLAPHAAADHGSIPDSTCEAMASVSAVEAPICFELRHALADMRTALLSEQENTTTELTTANVTLAAILTELENDDSGSLAGVVSLSSGDRERLDLTWWGTWAIVGLMFALILAPRWFGAFRVTQGG